MELHHRSEVEDVGAETRRTLADTEYTCDPYHTQAQKTRRTSSTLHDDRWFICIVYSDPMNIYKTPVLYTLYEATYLQFAQWLRDLSLKML